MTSLLFPSLSLQFKANIYFANKHGFPTPFRPSIVVPGVAYLVIFLEKHA